MSNKSPVIYTADIETAPIGAHVWSLFDQNVGLEQITSEWAILSVCAKRLGSKKRDVVYVDTSDKEDPLDDYELCGKLWEILNEADFIIGHNAQKFDLRKINARLIMHGFPPPSPVKVVDTMLIARSVAAFTSNKLAWLSGKLSKTEKLAHAQFSGHSLWRECLAGNPKAWAEMRKYNIVDVIATEELYLALRPWAKQHPNVAIFAEADTAACPRCGSDDIKQDGHVFTNAGKYERFKCGHCGGWSKGRYSRNSKESRKVQYAAA